MQLQKLNNRTAEGAVFKDKRYREISGVLLFLAGIIFLLGIVSYIQTDYRALVFNRPVLNLIGPVGALLGHIFRSAFGLSSYLFVMMLFLSGWAVFKNGDVTSVADKLFALFFLTISFSSFLAIGSADIYQNSGGFIGYYIYHFFKSTAGLVGAYLVIVIMNLVGLILLGTVSLTAFFENGGVSGSGKKFRKILEWISVKKYDDQIPLNNIGEDSYSGKKVPWVTKKRIPIGKKEKIKEDSVKYLEMNVSAAASENIFKGTDEKIAGILRVSEVSHEERMLKEDEFGLDDDFGKDFNPDKDAAPAAVKSEPIVAEKYYKDGNFHKYDEEFTRKPDAKSEIKKPDEDYLVKKNRIFEIDEEIPASINEMSDEADPEPEIEDIKQYEKIFPDPDQIVAEEQVFKQLKINKEYIIPTSFLYNSDPVDTETWETEIKKNSQLLVRTLADFGIESRVINVNRGPVITLYEMQIAAGIKITRVVGLADDIAMALAAYRVRIVAPIPGKSAIGVELPNRKREMVTLGDIIKSKAYQEQKGSLRVALGKDVLGAPVMLDLKKQPHLLIAGATGAGKSVCVNSIISSLVYNYDPNYVRFILVDPKMVELQFYNGTPHLLTPVITEPHLAPAVLKWSIFEMERRYRLLAAMNTRDIISYNEKVAKERKGGEKIPFIVIIIDELADLMMVASKDIEGYITRIAQKARAVGIHLVLATQRPSVDVITGIIKANFPARIAFQVAQKTDSRTIIDQNGAEKLLGKGDMLYQSPTSSYPVRIQGAFISEDEVMEIVTHLRTLGTPDYIDFEASIFQDEDGEINDENDELFVEALKIIEETRKASASYLQRRLSIGYNRAARMIEKMEELGYIGPQQGSKPRDIFI
jgi:DNA segregation ATPase FtsK/SpoIIIE-like protein